MSEIYDDDYEPEYDMPSEPDRQEIARYHEDASRGDVDSIYMLGHTYHAHRDYNLALLYLKQAAKEGSVQACLLIADMYEYGDGVQRDPGARLKWLESAGDLGDVGAMIDAAALHYHGDSNYIYPDQQQAILWLRKAAKFDVEKAEEALGYYDSIVASDIF